MIHGIVVGLQPQVSISLRLAGNQSVEIECIVDTGFAGALTLPPSVVAQLELPFVIRIDANLANDSTGHN